LVWQIATYEKQVGLRCVGCEQNPNEPQIKGVLKKRLTPAIATTKNPHAMMLCDEDYKAYHSLDAVELGNQKLFAE
jgi:hypothetical protein